MKHYIKFQVTETRIVELKREPTQEEIDMIKGVNDDNMYSTPDDLIDWETEDVYEADHHWVKLFKNDKEL